MTVEKMTLKRRCRECGCEYEAQREASGFCKPACRKVWNNRRALRGAELYDLFMVMRYRRPLGKLLDSFNALCRMARVWNDEDKKAGRVSFAESEVDLRARLSKYPAD